MADDKKTLARAVNVDGEWYYPGGDVPDDVAERITNPKAWKSGDDLADKRDEDGAVKPAGTADGAVLARTVHVDGVAYGPGDPVPDDVAKKIRNPKAWDGGKLPDYDTETPEPAKTASDTGNGGPADGPAGALEDASTGTTGRGRRSAATPTKRA